MKDKIKEKKYMLYLINRKIYELKKESMQLRAEVRALEEEQTRTRKRENRRKIK